MELPVHIAGEWSGAITALSGSVATLRSPKAFPPGQPLEFVLTAANLRIECRAIGSKRDGEVFELRVRLINLRKDARETLERAWSGERGSVERG